jgi:tetrapyrrole methylase family protein / MazG family protein
MSVNKIQIVGLGAGDIDQLPLGIYKLLKNSKKVYLRTKEHPVVEELVRDEGMQFTSYDHVYEAKNTFDEVYESICDDLISKAAEGSLLYAVPGHPLVAERTAQILLERAGTLKVEIEVIGGQSFLDPLFQAVQMDPIEGFQLLDGTNLKRDDIQVSQHVIIGQVYDTFIASEVKLTLMEKYPYDHDVVIVTAAGTTKETVKKVELHELDREVTLNNLTSVYVAPIQREELTYKEFSKLRNIIAELRGPNGCPWDKKQTHQSLKKYLIEEVYELIEAINEEDIDHMIEELGDVLLQVMLHAQIGEDEGYFSIDEVIEGISSKMVRRHPHVFGDATAETTEDVLKNWQEIKLEEKGEQETSILDGIGTHLPNLIRAYEIQKKAAKVGFDWENVVQAWEKVKEELQEFEVELSKETHTDDLQKEFGDILFALVNIARFLQIQPEEALFQTNQKFMRRFAFIEAKVLESGKSFDKFTLEELDKFWNEAKKEEQ